MKRVLWILPVVIALLALPKITAQQQTQDDLRKQIGTIIVTPGGGPSLAVADFQSRASGVDSTTAAFNEVLLNDLRFAGIANIKTVENNGAVPPGMYKPTFSIPTDFRQQ